MAHRHAGLLLVALLAFHQLCLVAPLTLAPSRSKGDSLWQQSWVPEVPRHWTLAHFVFELRISEVGLQHAADLLLTSSHSGGAADWRQALQVQTAHGSTSSASTLMGHWLRGIAASLSPAQRQELASEASALQAAALRQAAASSAAANGTADSATEAAQHRLMCKVPLLHLAANFVMLWQFQSHTNQEQPEGVWIEERAASMQSALAAVASIGSSRAVMDATGAAHRALLLAHVALTARSPDSFIAAANSSASQAFAPSDLPGLAELLAAEAAIDHGAAALGWQWQAFSNLTAAAQQQFDSGWQQPRAGARQCAEEWNMLRLMYSSRGNNTAHASLAEQLETFWGTESPWLRELRKPGMLNTSSMAEIALVGGQLRVQFQGALAWALPMASLAPRPGKGTMLWSPQFATGHGSLWRLVATFDHSCVHLGFMSDRRLDEAVLMIVKSVTATVVTEHAAYGRYWLPPRSSLHSPPVLGFHNHTDGITTLPGCWSITGAFLSQPAANHATTFIVPLWWSPPSPTSL